MEIILVCYILETNHIEEGGRVTVTCNATQVCKSGTVPLGAFVAGVTILSLNVLGGLAQKEL